MSSSVERYERAWTKRSRNSRRIVAGQRLDRLLAHAQQDLVAGAAAEREQPRRAQIVVVDEHPRAEAECADAPARLLGDDAADRERLAADQDRGRRPRSRAASGAPAAPARPGRAADRASTARRPGARRGRRTGTPAARRAAPPSAPRPRPPRLAPSSRSRSRPCDRARRRVASRSSSAGTHFVGPRPVGADRARRRR